MTSLAIVALTVASVALARDALTVRVGRPPRGDTASTAVEGTVAPRPETAETESSIRTLPSTSGETALPGNVGPSVRPETSPGAGSFGPATPPAVTAVRFDILAGVTPDDEAVIRNGITAGESWLQRRARGIRSSNVTIRVEPGATSPAGSCCGLYLSSEGLSILIVTGHEVWRSAASTSQGDTRAKIAAHELAHVAQHELGCSRTGITRPPAWFMEGMAEWIGYEVAVEAGWIARSALENTTKIAMTQSVGVSLSQSEQGLGPLNYLIFRAAFDRLVARSSFDASVAFCNGVGSGSRWQDAFATAFGISIESFYGDFDSYRASR